MAKRKALVVAIAGGALSVALVDFLTNNKTKVLTPDNAREILTDAKTQLEHAVKTFTVTGVEIVNHDAVAAVRVIAELHDAVA